MQEILKSKDIAHCPICDANAVEPCHEPKIKECPRGEDRKTDE
ncbi:MAG: hypothetical protein ACLFUB_15020 [Cyclobacteriaceae bacterium]